jgi:hypothetical protein
MAQGRRPNNEKARWMPVLSDARLRATDLLTRLRKDPEQMMSNLAESWRDRETGVVAELETDTSAAPEEVEEPQQSGGRALRLQNGLPVRHIRFGNGVITDIHGSDDRMTVTIMFDDEQQRSFLVSLVRDKLEVLG